MSKFNFTKQELSNFKELGVSSVILFGSRALGLAAPNSDYDFGILLNKRGLLEMQKRKGEMLDALRDIFSSHILRLVDIDVVFLQSAPGELQAHAVKHAQVLYEEKNGAFLNFKAKVMQEYADFSPLRKIFHQGILSRIQ